MSDSNGANGSNGAARTDEKVRVAIVGTGNCANSFIQGVQYYKDADPSEEVPGLMHVDLGGYHVGDVEFVAAFDIDSEKVGKDLSEAIWSGQNDTIKFADVGPMDVEVHRGMTHDGLGKYLKQKIKKAPGETADIVGILQEACTHAGVPAVSLWAAVPHYVSQPPNPKATLALLNRLEDLIDLRIPLGELPEDARAWQVGVDQLAAEDSEVAEYVQTLEEARDTAELPEASGEAIAREFERYLRRRDGGPGPAGPGSHATDGESPSYLRDTGGGRTRPPRPQRPENDENDESAKNRENSETSENDGDGPESSESSDD